MRRRNFISGLAVALLVPSSLRAATKRSPLTIADLWILRRQTTETLAEWSCILNSWGWPKLIPDPEPPTYIADGRRSAIMDWISKKIGHKTVLWKHNQSVMTREQFEDWYDSWHGGDKEGYRKRNPLDDRDFNEELKKRRIHKWAMYARHGAKHPRYDES